MKSIFKTLALALAVSGASAQAATGFILSAGDGGTGRSAGVVIGMGESDLILALNWAKYGDLNGADFAIEGSSSLGVEASFRWVLAEGGSARAFLEPGVYYATNEGDSTIGYQAGLGADYLLSESFKVGGQILSRFQPKSDTAPSIMTLFDGLKLHTIFYF